jgi:glycosyltransferase involved in cell wall biosynthesis
MSSRYCYDSSTGREPDRPFDYTARRPRILFLSVFIPWDPMKSVWGAFQRLGNHLTALDRLGPVDLAFVSPAHEQLSPSMVAAVTRVAHQMWPLRGSVYFVAPSGPKSLFGRISDVYWASRGFVGFVADRPSMDTCRRRQIESLEHILRLSQPDLIFAHRLSAAVPLLRIKSRLPPIVVDFDDLESVSLERLAMSTRDLGAILAARFGALLARLAQRRVSAIATALLVCSELEQRRVQSMGTGGHVFTIPNTAASLGNLPSPSKPVAIFVGTAHYPPNREALLWFTNEVWPRIRRAVPEARLIVVGDKTDDLGISSEKSGIETVGFVESLAPIYAAAMLAICPIRRGSGTRIKIIEAAVNGRPVVSTTLGAEGLDFRPGAEILLEDDSAGFADACVQLFQDPARASQIGKAAMQRARSTYQESRVADRLRAICTDALGDKLVIGSSSSE